MIIEDKYSSFSPKDSELWKTFLYTANSCSEDLYHILDWFRAVGTKLVEDETFGYRIVPVIGKNGWSSMAEWNNEKKALNRFQKEIIKILYFLKERNVA